MAEEYNKTELALAMSDIKTAALYCPQVMPLGMLRENEFDESVGKKTIKEITLSLISEENYKKFSALPGYTSWEIGLMHDTRFQQIGVLDEFRSRLLKKYINQLHNIVGTEKLSYIFWSHPDDIDSTGDIESGIPDTFLALRNLKLVDTNKVPLAQILAFRKDETASKRLRNLRLGLLKDYSGKSPSFIADDLSRRIEEHDGAIKAWGLETGIGALKAALSPSSAAVTSVAALAVAAFGAPISLAAATTAIATVGLATLEVYQSYSRLRALEDQNSVTYLADLKDRL